METGSSTGRRVVAVRTGDGIVARSVTALAAAFDVDIVVDLVADVDGIIWLGEAAPARTANVHVPELRLPRAEDEEIVLDGAVEFARSALLDARLGGRRVHDRSIHRASKIVPAPDDVIIATCGSVPLWSVDTKLGARVDTVALAPPDLRPGDTLRDHLQAARFQRLVPLVQFFREISGYYDATQPGLRATFLFDDPNLHWPTYGYVRYAELAAHARLHGYHAAMATIPLDAWFAHPRAARVFREQAEQLSLIAHGNNHVRRELACEMSPRRRRAMLSQARSRLDRLSAATGARVDRVLAPPHGAACADALAAALEVGFDAMCMSNAVPSDERASDPAAGWHPATVAPGRVPIIPRMHLSLDRDDLVFRALLDQPIVLYGHHWDLASGLDTLAAAVADVNALGPASWSSLGEICRTNFAFRRDGSTLRVRAFSPRILVDVPAGIDLVHVDGGAFGATRVTVSESSRVEILLHAPNVGIVPGPPTLVEGWPVVRRVITEARDRSLPVARTFLPRSRTAKQLAAVLARSASRG